MFLAMECAFGVTVAGLCSQRLLDALTDHERADILQSREALHDGRFGAERRQSVHAERVMPNDYELLQTSMVEYPNRFAGQARMSFNPDSARNALRSRSLR
jgi:hypothetical protein